MHGFGTSLIACYGIVALLYGYELTGLWVPILGTLWFAALLPLHPLMEDNGCIGWGCIFILLTCLFVCRIPRSVGGTSSTTPSDGFACI